MSNYLETVRELMVLTFGISPDKITLETVQADISEWDSIGHLNLMLSLEDTFNLTLDVDDLTRLNSVAAILGYLKEKE